MSNEQLISLWNTAVADQEQGRITQAMLEAVGRWIFSEIIKRRK